MPYLSLETNARPDQDRAKSMLTDLVNQLAEAMNKPASIFMIRLSNPEAAPLMHFGGDSSPCVYAELSGIALDPDSTPRLTTIITDAVSQAIGIPPNRIFVRFQDTERSHWGVDGKTLADR